MFALPSRMCLLLRKKPQSEGRRSMATLKTISIRLKSVKNIQKITKSMKMVSAAKYSRAERELKQAKPLGEGIKKFYTNAAIQPEELPEGQVHKQLYIAVTSDRGLCGAVHTSIAKMIRKTIGEPTENIKVVCIGDKAKSLLQKFFKENILFVCTEVGRLPATFQDASLIVKHIMESEFQYHMAKIVYNRFRSVVSYVTEDLTFFSVKTVLESPSVQAYEDADEETVSSFVEFTMAALIYYALKESSCSEQSSRMTAMDNASKNAGEMISKLTLTFNRTRQAVITRELIEIISGASAL